MKDIATVIRENNKQSISYKLSASWYFNKWYEKLILIVLCLLGLIRIYEWAF